jgi:hypothetical protein
VAAKEAEKLLHEISNSTAIAEKEKQKVAVIVDAVTRKVRPAAVHVSHSELGRPWSSPSAMPWKLAVLDIWKASVTSQ